MLYKRSSFIKWLINKHGCTAMPLPRTNVLIVESKWSTYKMWINPKDIIDYEEIDMACQKLHIQDLPGDKDLIKVKD